MIQIIGMTATSKAPDGSTITTSALNWQDYSKVLNILDSQQQAARDNTKAQSDYLTALNTYQLGLDNGRGSGTTAPHKPQLKVVQDWGDVSYVDFNPPLPDPVVPVTFPSTVHGLVNTSIPLPTVQPTPVEQAIMAGMVAMTNTLNSLVAALTAKGII